MGFYEDFFPSLAPPWLKQPRGAAYLGGLGKVTDEDLLDRTKQAVKARIVEEAPLDALPALGRERLLERFPGMTDDAYRAYLLAAWATWPQGGTEAGLVAALSAAYPGPSYSAIESGDNPSYPLANWAAFYVLVRDPLPWSQWAWGDPGVSWGQAGLTWGSTATPEEIDLLRSVTRKVKGGHNEFAGIVVQLPVEIIWPPVGA